ncbi:MAG: Hsp20/alpha crystallin family protein [Desulfuromonadales bacterium]|nr:Hsp20/alpha crystallin family protein [Desulfuromonadales bacterium]
MRKQEIQAKPEAIDNQCAAGAETGYVRPLVDIYEAGDVMTLVAEMPGLDEAKLQVSVEQGILSIEAPFCSADEAPPQHREFVRRGYRCKFHLPEVFDAQGISATVKEGILSLRLPKAQAAQARSIEVTVH